MNVKVNSKDWTNFIFNLFKCNVLKMSIYMVNFNLSTMSIKYSKLKECNKYQ